MYGFVVIGSRVTLLVLVSMLEGFVVSFLVCWNSLVCEMF